MPGLFSQGSQPAPVLPAVKTKTQKNMITSRKVSQVNVFAGSPWEVASVKSLLKAAYIEASMKDNGLNSILISVPCEYYTAAMRVINKRKVS